MNLSDYIPVESLEHVKVSGADLMERIGHDELREIVVGVLCGENVRTATEPLTRRRISALNAALLLTLARASKVMTPQEVLRRAHHEYRNLPTSDPRRIVLMWILGLTNKQVQNVLRSDEAAWSDFVKSASQVADESARFSAASFGELKWTLEVAGDTTEWNWIWAHSFMIPVGSQALATRGSEKSMYGKFFEKLVLGSVLDILGFTLDPKRSGADMTYWLSERGERRESDATALVADQQGVRFDIGFIGPGNPEITLDKVSRFARVDEIAGRQFEMTTVIIVDRIGEGSRIVDLAEEIDGKILQMSSSLWAKDLDDVLSERCSSYCRVFSSDAEAADIRRMAMERLGANELQRLLGTVGTL